MDTDLQERIKRAIANNRFFLEKPKPTSKVQYFFQDIDGKIVDGKVDLLELIRLAYYAGIHQALSEPKQKFKIGDHIKCVKNDGWEWAVTKGFVYTVQKYDIHTIANGWSIWIEADDDGDPMFVFEGMFELYPKGAVL